MHHTKHVDLFLKFKRRGMTASIVSALLAVTLLLGACDTGNSPPVVDTVPDDQVVEGDQNLVATPAVVEEDADVVATPAADEEAAVAASDTMTSDLEADDVTIITSTELITGTEVTTDIQVTTDTTVLEQNLITTVITATDMVTDTTGSSDSSTTTETEVITDTTELPDETGSGEVEADVNVTPIAPTPTPTVIVQVTRVVTDTQVVTDTVKMTAVATPRPGQTPQADANGGVVMAFIGVEGSTGRSIRATTLNDADFVTADGDVNGEIQDLVINMQTGQVVYVLLEYGGLFDIGDTDMPVPLSAFSWNTEDQLVLNVDGQQLEEFPGVSNDWPVPDEDNWDLDVRNFWGNLDIETDFDAAEVASGIRRASDILDDPISDVSYGEGAVEDMIISLEEGRVTYVLVSFAGANLDEGWYVIPMDAFDPNSPRDGLYLNPDFDANLLESAPRYDEANYGGIDVYDQDYDADWRSYWQDNGYMNDAQ